MLEEFPEHNNGEADIYIARFRNLQTRCEEEVQRYARHPQEIDLLSPNDPNYVPEPASLD